MNKDYVAHHTSRPYQIKAAKEKLPVAYIGLGILEWHGEHNAVGLDGVKADGVAIHFARKFGGVVAPPLFWGDFRERIAEIVFIEECFDHTVPICEMMGYDKASLVKNARRGELYGGWALWITLMTHILFELESFGYKSIVPIPGHYPLISPLNLAIERFKLEGGTCDVYPITDKMYDNIGESGDHAGKFETSLMMAMFPELVELDRLDGDLSKVNIGVGGEDPRVHASAEFGQEILAKFDSLLEAHFKEVGLL